MRIKTWKAWHDLQDSPEITASAMKFRRFPSPVRIVPEATWRKVMAVVIASEYHLCGNEDLEAPLSALREHEKKRK